MSLEPLAGPVPIQEGHETLRFVCQPDLDQFLQRFALASDRAHTCKTFVVSRGLRVVGYYSLCAACAEYDQVPSRLQKGAARHLIPLTLLARLAVDRSEQGRGLGAALLKDAFKRFLAACDLVASRGLVTHAKEESACRFYQRYGFEEWPADSKCLYMPTKDVKKTLL